jgi:organic hydroperoxide reductase OsmC/OhrA
MEKDASGKIAVTKVILRPKVNWGGDNRPAAEQIADLHHRAHEACFIANSVKTEVAVAPIAEEEI